MNPDSPGTQEIYGLNNAATAMEAGQVEVDPDTAEVASSGRTPDEGLSASKK